MKKRILSVVLATGSLLAVNANAGLVQLGFNHTTNIYQQGAYTTVLRDLVMSQTNPYNYGDGFGYNDFQLDIRFSGFNYQTIDDTGKLYSGDNFNVESMFSVDFEDDVNQAAFVDVAESGQFYQEPTRMMLISEFPDGFAGALLSFYDREKEVTVSPDGSLSDIQPYEPNGSHLAMTMDGTANMAASMDPMFIGLFTQSFFEDTFIDTYEGFDSGLVNPSQADVDQFVADNFVTAMSWRFLFTRTLEGDSQDDSGYNIEMQMIMEYADSAKSNVESLFEDNFKNALIAATHVSQPLLGLSEATTSYAFVDALPPAPPTLPSIEVPEPKGVLLFFSGLLALLWVRRSNQSQNFQV